MKEGTFFPVTEDRNRITIGLLLVSGGAGGAAVHVTVRQVAVTVACRGTGDNRGTILLVKKQIEPQNLTNYSSHPRRVSPRTC